MNFKTTDMLSFISYKINSELSIDQPNYFEELRNLQKQYDFWDSFDSYLRDGNGETYVKDAE